MTLWRVLVLFVLAVAFSSPAIAGSLLLKNGSLVDPATKTIAKKDILIVDGRIGPTLKFDPAHPPYTLDVQGKWIIPGLIDLHVHCGHNCLPDGSNENLGPHETAKLMLFSGVCAYLDLAYLADIREFFAARDEQRANPKKFNNESDIYGVGSAFSRWNLTPENTEGEIIYYIHQWKPDVIKLIYGRNMIEKSMLEKAIKGASKEDVKTVVHIGSWEHAGDAIKAGATVVTHFFDDEVVPDDLVKLWSKSDTLSIPTMAVQCDMANFCTHPQLLKSPLLMDMEKPSALKKYQDRAHFSEKARDTLKWQKEDMKNDFESFRKLSHAGVVMLAGSDTGNHGTFQGFSLHREIKLMQDAGYSCWDALASATTRAAEFLKRPSGIKTGETAELVILDANPIADIANTQKIFAVIHHGTLVDRKALLVR